MGKITRCPRCGEVLKAHEETLRMCMTCRLKMHYDLKAIAETMKKAFGKE